MDVSQYLDIFIDETNGHIQALNDNIMILEKEPENKDVINEIFRAAHSLKGMAGTMGFKKMQRLTHDMENVFQEIRNDNIKVNSNLIDILFSCLDAIEEYLETVKATSDEGDNGNEALIQQLNDYLNGGATAAPAEEAVETKAAPAKEEAASDGLSHMEVDDVTYSKIKEAQESGLHIYEFTVHIQKDCLLKAARAFLVFKAVEDFGEILAYNPSSQDIEDEKFDLDFSLVVASSQELQPIVDAIKAVSEIEGVDAKESSHEEFMQEEEPEAAPDETESAQPAGEEVTSDIPETVPDDLVDLSSLTDGMDDTDKTPMEASDNTESVESTENAAENGDAGGLDEWEK